MQRKFGTLEAGLVITGLFLPTVAVAATPKQVCPVAHNHNKQQKPRALLPADVQAGAVYIEADQAMFREAGPSILQGDVLIARNKTLLRADQATYSKETQQVTAKGEVYLISAGLELQSEQLNYNLESDTGSIQQANYQVDSADGRGGSETIIREENDITRMVNASYTTCPVDNESWRIQAGSIELDHANEQGTARNLSLQINNTPLLYLPYFSFPLTDKRKSGLLTPSFGSSENSGVRVSLPYYFNLAPNYDLTVTPNFFSKRGVQLESEFRYLFPKHDGTFRYEFLYGDNERNGDNRYYFDLEHYSHTGPNSELTLRAEGVSDNNYFNDLGTSLAASSIVKLERTLSYNKIEADWSFSALVQDYQVLDNSTEAYARLPQIKAQWRPNKDEDGPDWQLDGEYTFFSDTNAVDGHRADLHLGVKQRFSNAFAYITPSASLRHTAYQLDQTTDKTISRTLPTASLDAGMFFERELRDGKWIQTLEPRLYYTFTPFKDQSAIPVFDSSGKTLSYSQLFNSNRFTGKDRIEDANRLSTSITTRIQDTENGREVFRASIGQMYHFDERQVTLPGETLETGSRSEVVFEAAGELNASTRMTATAFVDTSEKQVSASQLRINYKDRKERILNLGYSQRKGEYEATHLSFATPVTQEWKFAGGYEHDLQNDRMLEALLGMEYRSCCWKGRIAGRKYLLSDNTTYDDAIFIEVELKGLGNFGSGARNFLSNRIYGYE
ncbi:MAG: LPS-assembly protein LptD [Thiolinea sp.]